MTEDLSRALDECMTLMRRGADIEACVARYPHIRGQLLQLLETAVTVSTSPKVVPSSEFRRTSKARLLSRIREDSIHARAERPRQSESPFGALGALLGSVAEAVLPSGGLTVRATSALLVAMAALLVVYSVFTFLPQQSSLSSQGTVSVLSGHVSVQDPSTGIWRDAEDGMVVDTGMRVRTGQDSNAMLTFFDGSTIRLEGDSDVQVERIVRADGQSTEIVLKQWLGRTWSRVAKKADPASKYEIQTPSTYALVRGTLFEVEVDEDGSTVVRTIEGLVSVGAQGQAVEVSAGQATSVSIGEFPVEPAPIPAADNELLITVSMPAVASVSDPGQAGTGYLPSGMAFNQITGSQSSSPTEGDQVIRIPRPEAGLYHVILRGVGDGTTNVSVEGVSGGESIFKQVGSYEVTNGSGWVLGVGLELRNGRISDISVSDIEPLTDQTYEDVVTTKLEAASLVPIEPPEGWEDPVVVKPTYGLTVTSGNGGAVTVPGEGTFTYASDAVVELIARPDEGYDFINWTGDVDNPLSAVTTVNVSRDQAVSARFAEKIHVLTIVSRGGGTVPEPGESISMRGTRAVVTLVANPDVGWEFDSWTGNVADPTSPTTTITMRHAETVIAVFVPRR